MATIKEVQQLDVSKIKSEALSEQIKKLLQEYEAISDKAFFLEQNQLVIDKFFDLTKKNYPDAVPPKQNTVGKTTKKRGKKPTDLRELTEKALVQLTDLGIALEEQDESIMAATRLHLSKALEDTQLEEKVKKAVQHYQTHQGKFSKVGIRTKVDTILKSLFKAVGGQPKKPKSPPKKKKEATADEKAKSKAILKELEALEPELEACRTVIRDYNKKRREAQGPRPKKSRYTRLKENLLSLIRLIPDKLKQDAKTLANTEKILLKTHKDIVEAWGMSKLKAQSGAAAIQDKIEGMEPAVPKTDKAKEDHPLFWVGFEYRGPKRTSAFFQHIDSEYFPEVKTLKKGDTITMGAYGILNEIVFFNSQLYPHDKVEGDHNRLQVTSIHKVTR